MIVAHLSDLHLRDTDDAAGFAHQLDRIVARTPDHLVITGDLLDRWNPPLLEHALDLLAARGLLDADALTIIHGNHDLASSGGHPRQRADLWRLAARFWDPPPLIAARKREFYRRIAARAPNVALAPPASKATAAGLQLAAVDSVPMPWVPLSIGRGRVALHHAEGAIPGGQIDWLSRQASARPLVVLLHHYPLPVGSFRWDVGGTFDMKNSLLARFQHWQVVVRMEIEAGDRARFWEAVGKAGACAVLCGHVHRARLEQHGAVAVGLNGQSGAEWAGRTIAYYRIGSPRVSVEYESAIGAVAAGVASQPGH